MIILLSGSTSVSIVFAALQDDFLSGFDSDSDSNPDTDTDTAF